MKYNIEDECVKCDGYLFIPWEEIEAKRNKKDINGQFYGIEMVCSNCVKGDKTERDKEIRELREQGLTYKQIGERIGLTYGGVQGALNKMKRDLTN